MPHPVWRPARHPRDAGHRSLWIGGISASQGLLPRESILTGTACPPEGTTVTGPRPPLLLPAFTLVLRFHSYPVKEPRPRGWGPAGLPACWAACALLAWELLRGGRWDTVSYLFPPDSVPRPAALARPPGVGGHPGETYFQVQLSCCASDPPARLCPRRQVGLVWAAPWCLAMWPGVGSRPAGAPSPHPQPPVQAPACLTPPQTLGGLGSAAAEVLGGAPPCCPVSRAAQPRSELIVLPQLLRACPPPPGQSAGGG